MQEVLDRMEMGKDSVMVVHGGGKYGDKQKTLDRWCEILKDYPRPFKTDLYLKIVKNVSRLKIVFMYLERWTY